MAKEKTKERKKRSKRKERKVKRKQSRVSLETHSKPARAYARRRLPYTCTYDEAGAAVDEIVGNCFGSVGDIDLWAWYCRHFDRRRIVDKAYEYASMQRQSEVRDAVTAFQAWPKGRTWRDMDIPERTFWDRLKKVKKFFGLENIG